MTANQAYTKLTEIGDELLKVDDKLLFWASG